MVVTLTGKEAVKIRRLLRTGISPYEIADTMGVDYNAVLRIRDGQAWEWLTDEMAEIMEHYYDDLGYNTVETMEVLNRLPQFCDAPLSDTSVRKMLRRYGILRTQSQANELSWKKYYAARKEAILGGIEKTVRRHGRYGRVELSRDLLRQWYLEESLTLGEIQRKLATMGIRICIGTITNRLKEYGLWEKKSVRWKRFIQRGIVPDIHKNAPSKRDASALRRVFPAKNKQAERLRVKSAFPAPLGQCELGKGEAKYRFRIDFYEHPFVDKETSGFAIIRVCRRHGSYLGVRRWMLGLPRTVDSGKRILSELEENPVSCDVRKKVECVVCEKVFSYIPRPSKPEHITCGPRCGVIYASKAAKEKGQLLMEARVMLLLEEEYSLREIQSEARRRWSGTVCQKYSLSKSSVSRIRRKWEARPRDEWAQYLKGHDREKGVKS